MPHVKARVLSRVEATSDVVDEGQLGMPFARWLEASEQGKQLAGGATQRWIELLSQGWFGCISANYTSTAGERSSSGLSEVYSIRYRGIESANTAIRLDGTRLLPSLARAVLTCWATRGRVPHLQHSTAPP